VITLDINGKTHELDIADDMPLLYALRNQVGLNGAKYAAVWVSAAPALC
jgi:nicotinate dehydrogenase subunit A